MAQLTAQGGPIGALRRFLAILLAFAATSALVLAQPSAAVSPRVTRCTAPDGTDVQAKYGLSVSVVVPVCTEIRSGAWWTTGAGWYSATTWEGIPAGYHPLSSSPIDDFVAYFVSFRLYVDEGTPHAFTIDWANGPDLWRGSSGTYDLANPITLGTVRPLSIGTHTVRRVLVMSQQTCDGTSSDPDLSCLPAGETDVGTVQFTVVK